MTKHTTEDFLNAQASALFEKCGTDFEKAKAALIKAPRLQEYFLRLGFNHALAAFYSAGRQTERSAPMPKAAPRGADKRTAARLSNSLRSFLGVFMVDGEPIGKRTHEELIGAAERAEARAAGLDRFARMCRKVAEFVPAGKTADDALSDADLMKIHKARVEIYAAEQEVEETA